MGAKKFNITYATSIISVGSAIVSADNIAKALAKFERIEDVLAIVEINIENKVKPITMMANLEEMTLLRNGKKEKITIVEDDVITTELGTYNKSEIKCLMTI